MHPLILVGGIIVAGLGLWALEQEKPTSGVKKPLAPVGDDGEDLAVDPAPAKKAKKVNKNG